MSTAEKLTYLNDTKQLLKENINSLGGNLTNEPFRQYASVLDGIYESLPKVSGIGASLSLSPSLMGKIKLNEIQGNTLQENTPTPSSPVPIQSVTGLQNINVCGKNLFDKDGDITNNKYYDGSGNATAGTGDFIDNTYIAVESGDYVLSSPSSTTLRICTYDSNKTFIERKATTSTSLKITITNEKYIRISGKTDLINTLQFEKGSATTYEPYKGNTYEVNLGNIELNKIGTYEDSIKKSTGKNLFNGVFELGGYNTVNGQKGDANDRIRCADYIKVEPNTTYTFSFGNEGTSYFLDYDNSKTYLNTYTQINYHSKTGTITTGQNTSYITFYYIPYNHTLTTDELCQIEQNNQATSYEPYGKVWYIHKEIGKVNLEDYEYNKYGASAGYSRNTTTQIPNIKYVSVNTELGKGLCEKYQIHTGTGMSGSDAENHFAIDVSMFQVTIPNNDTPSGLFYYALATPTYTTITNTELIEQLESLYNAKSEDGTTNINITSEDLSMLLNVGVLKGE